LPKSEGLQLQTRPQAPKFVFRKNVILYKFDLSSIRKSSPQLPANGETMPDISEIDSVELSRRSILRKLGFAASGAAVLATAIGANRVAVAQTKMSQKVVGYQDTPQGDHRCDNCLQFQLPSSCKVVEGNINPAGWCKVYVKKPA
jgi:hypothetical protein